MKSPHPTHSCVKPGTREGMKQASSFEQLLSPALILTDFKGESHPGFPRKEGLGIFCPRGIGEVRNNGAKLQYQIYLRQLAQCLHKSSQIPKSTAFCVQVTGLGPLSMFI